MGLVLGEIAVGACLVLFLWYMRNRTELFPWKDYPVIAHAMGGMEDKTYLNVKEGFQRFYEEGCRMFEVDLAQTSDGVWVCRHGWKTARGQWKGKKGKVLTAKEFLAAPVYGEYTPLSLEDLFLLMKEYPDAYVLLDSKKYADRDFQNTAEDFSAYIEIARKAGCEEVLDRVIPEIYNEEMYRGAVSVYRFRTYLYSLWQEYSPEELRDAALFCREKRIPVVCLNDQYWTEEIQDLFTEQGVLVNVYTVNDEERARQLMKAGVSGVCTDTIFPEALEGEKTKS